MVNRVPKTSYMYECSHCSFASVDQSIVETHEDTCIRKPLKTKHKVLGGQVTAMALFKCMKCDEEFEGEGYVDCHGDPSLDYLDEYECPYCLHKSDLDEDECVEMEWSE